jgi:hypothetical protein
MHKVHFPSRELENFAEPVPLLELKIGAVYYRAEFLDADMTIPLIEPYVYIGFEHDFGDEGGYEFQAVGSCLLKDDRTQQVETDPAEVIFILPGSIGLYDFEEALNILLRCSLRRSAKKK